MPRPRGYFPFKHTQPAPRARMQAALRNALAEVARGASTGFVVLAGARCPACPACTPHLHCPGSPTCPDCVCTVGERGPWRPACTEGYGSFALVAVFVAGFLAGLCVLALAWGCKPASGKSRGRGVLRIAQ